MLLRTPDDPQPIIAEGRWPGRILHAPRGDGGFGYDPVFLDPLLDRSAAELLLYLHSGMMVTKGSAGRVAITAGRTS